MVVDVQLNANVYVKSKLEYESQKDLLIWRQPRPRPLARHVFVDVVLPVAVGVVSSHITITMQMSLTMTMPMASPSAAHRAYCYICLTDIYLND